MVRPKPITPLDAVITRLDPLRVSGELLISLSEHSTSNVLTDHQQRVIAVNASQLKRMAITTQITRVGDRYQTRLVAGDQIGTLRLINGKEYVDIIVEPKVGNVSFFRILEFCYAFSTFQDKSIAYESGAPTASFLVEFIVRQIDAFLSARKYKSYSPKNDAETSHPRGHLDLVGYVGRQMPKLRLDRIGCSYFEFSENIFENQVLESTLVLATRLAASFDESVRRSIAERVAHARRFLQGVDFVRIAERQLDRHRYDRRTAHFRPIHELCRIILFNTSISLSPSRLVSFLAFSLNMNQLFEAYIRRLLEKALGPKIVPAKSRLSFLIHGTESKVILDGLIDRRPACVVECKYKLVTSQDAIDFDEGKMKNADIFQCVAYATHSDVNADEVLLFYPSASENAPALQAVKSIRSFVGRNGKVVPITVVLANLAVSPALVLEALSDFLKLRFALPS